MPHLPISSPQTMLGIMFEPSGDSFPRLGDLDHCYYDALDYLYDDLLGDLADWYAIAIDPHAPICIDPEGEARDETNWDALLNSLQTELVRVRKHRRVMGDRSIFHDAEEIAAARGALVGRVLALAPDNPDLDVMLRCNAVLANDPLLDDAAFAERELAAWNRYAPDAATAEIRDAEAEGLLTDDEAAALSDDADVIAQDLTPCLEYYYGFSQDYSPPFLDLLAEVDAFLQGSER